MLASHTEWKTLERGSRPARAASWLRAGSAVAACLGLITAAQAGAGIATPPIPGGGSLPLLSTPAPFIPAHHFSGASPTGEDVHGFATIGFIQDATVDTDNKRCPEVSNPRQWGGTARVNDIAITIPCNMIVQFPANTLSWADMLNPNLISSTQSPPALLTLAAPPSGARFSFPSTEITIDGNVIAGEHVAGLVFISQQSLNAGIGYITHFDYPNGVIYVGNSPKGPDKARLQINDPKITADNTYPGDPAIGTGRYSAGQTPDSRFSVDQQNATIHAFTGYPMCVPRTDPAAGDDPRCPKQNRPLANACRNFSDAGVILPTGRELAPPGSGQTFCSGFVMKAPFGTVATGAIPGGFIAGPTEPDSRQQAPLEIGDYILWSGTLLKGDGLGPDKSDTISVNTINANVGIFTQPGSLPVYLMIGNFSVSAESPLLFGAIPQEPVNRLFIEAFVTDVTSIVDVYFVDFDPNQALASPAASQRWLTPASMTGGIGAVGSNGQLINGGITTQFSGLTPGRVRMQAVKSVPFILASPTRNMRVVARSLCDPANINSTATPIGAAANAPKIPCLQSSQAANGLYTGQYMAPVFNFIFPENAVPGDPRVPYDFWDFGFLVFGEGPGTGPLSPKPW